ncbi:MAG: type II toxin-antitoxin system VapC family toxin, partial [Gammaproteobacteria bacterium]
MHYLDTSVLAAVFFRERGAEALVARLRRWRQRPQLVSSWTLTEVASAGSLKVRTGAIGVSMREEALAHFQRFTSAHLRVVEIDPGDFRVAS